MASASVSPSISPSASASNSPSASPSASFSNSPSNSPSKSPSNSPSVSPSPIPAGEVSYTIHDINRVGRLKIAFVKVEFGSANDKYPSGGIPLTSGKMGMAEVKAVVILESNGNTSLYEYDKSANTIRIFTEARVEATLNVTDVAATALECMVVGK